MLLFFCVWVTWSGVPCHIISETAKHFAAKQADLSSWTLGFQTGEEIFGPQKPTQKT